RPDDVTQAARRPGRYRYAPQLTVMLCVYEEECGTISLDVCNLKFCLVPGQSDLAWLAAVDGHHHQARLAVDYTVDDRRAVGVGSVGEVDVPSVGDGARGNEGAVGQVLDRRDAGHWRGPKAPGSGGGEQEHDESDAQPPAQSGTRLSPCCVFLSR